MSELLTSIETWLSYLNIQVFGLKPFQFNATKTLFLAMGSAALAWTVLSKSTERTIDRWLVWYGQLTGAARHSIWFVAAAVTAGLGYLSLQQLWTYSNGAYDLAIYSNSLWHTAQGEWFFDAIKNEHLMGDHFGPFLSVFAPLYRLWPNPEWLLLIQAASIGLGALALGRIAYHATGSAVVVLLMLVLYGLNPYVHSIAGVGFHPIVLAIPLFLWMLYGVEKEEWWLVWVLAVLSLLVEESLPPGLVGLGIYVLISDKNRRRAGALLVLLGTVWFFLEVTVLLPLYSQQGLIHWDRYDNLGPDFRAAMLNLMTNPTLLVTEGLLRDGKLYYLSGLLLSVAFLPLLAWRQATLILLPAFMMLLSDTPGHYKFGFHYSAVVLPFLFYSAVQGAAVLQRRIARLPASLQSRRLLFAMVVLCLMINVYSIRWSTLTNIDYGHVTALSEVLAAIPSQASVRSEGNVLAALSSRHRIAPIVEDIDENFRWWDPDYFLFDLKHVKENSRTLAARHMLLGYLTRDERYRMVRETDGVLLLEKQGTTVGALGGAFRRVK